MSETAPEGPVVDEAALVAEAQRDPRRFAALYERHFDAVYAYVARRLPTRQDAEDVTAVVFQKALANIGRYEWRGVPFAAWLMRIAANEVADSARGRPSSPPAGTPTPPAADDEGFDSADVRATLYGLVRRLPDDQRWVVYLRFAEGRTVREIAGALGRSEGAVKQLQLRALRSLRAALGGADA